MSEGPTYTPEQRAVLTQAEEALAAKAAEEEAKSVTPVEEPEETPEELVVTEE